MEISKWHFIFVFEKRTKFKVMRTYSILLHLTHSESTKLNRWKCKLKKFPGEHTLRLPGSPASCSLLLTYSEKYFEKAWGQKYWKRVIYCPSNSTAQGDWDINPNPYLKITQTQKLTIKVGILGSVANDNLLEKRFWLQ